MYSTQLRELHWNLFLFKSYVSCAILYMISMGGRQWKYSTNNVTSHLPIFSLLVAFTWPGLTISLAGSQITSLLHDAVLEWLCSLMLDLPLCPSMYLDSRSPQSQPPCNRIRGVLERPEYSTMLLNVGKSAYRPFDCLISCQNFCDVHHTNPPYSYHNSNVKRITTGRAAVQAN